MARALKGLPGVSVGLLVLIWVGLPLVPEATGLKFGIGYRIFFTVMLGVAVSFFWLLGRKRIPSPSGTGGVLGSLAAVYALTVAALVTVGVVYPQFERPRPTTSVAQGAVERGKDLFWSPSVGCFRCHSVAGTGGSRGPDLTNVASRAGKRVPGMAAQQYIMEKVKAGSTYDFKVPEYALIMPPFGQMLSQQDIEDLVAHLLTLK